MHDRDEDSEPRTRMSFDICDLRKWIQSLTLFSLAPLLLVRLPLLSFQRDGREVGG